MLQTEPVSISHEIAIKKDDSLHYTLTGKDIMASVSMNPHDRMTFVSLDTLPQDPPKRYKAYALIGDALKSFGGKILISLPEIYMEELKGLKDSKALRDNNSSLLTMRIEAFLKSMESIKKKIGEPGYTLFYRPADYKEKSEALFQFKKQNADFVTREKIKDNIYGEDAELHKTQAATQFTLQDNTGKIFASLLIAHHKTLAYAADFIVDKEYRKQKLGEIICFLAFEKIFAENPHIQNITFIAGGAGQEAWCKKFYTETLPAKNFEGTRRAIASEKTFKGFTKMGVFASFGPPGKHMMCSTCEMTSTARPQPL